MGEVLCPTPGAAGMGGAPADDPVDAAEWGLSHPRGAKGFSGARPRKLTQKSPVPFHDHSRRPS